MSEKMPTSFKDGEFGSVPGVMLGGPIDGKRYKLPVLPNGSIPFGFGHPLQQPHETSPYANYTRAGDEKVGGYYVFIYEGTEGPDGQKAVAETPADMTRTCENYGAA